MEDISCSICFDPFSGNDHIPKVLECGHTFCSNCLEKLISGNPNGVCSICQKEIVIKESYPTNFAFLSLLDQKEKLNHNTSKLEAIATFQRQYPDDFKICEENIARITRGKRTIDSLITECDSVIKILNELKIEMANVPMQKAFEKLYELVDEIHHLKEASMTWIELEDFDDIGFLYKVNAKCKAGPVFLVHSVEKKDFYGRVSVVGNEIYVHSLSSEECERGSNATYVPFRDLKECWMNEDFKAFLKIECNEKGLEVIVKIQLKKSQLMNHFVKICTGELGPTYKGATYVKNDESRDNEFESNIIHIPDYVSNGELRRGEIDYVESNEDFKKLKVKDIYVAALEDGSCLINMVKAPCVTKCNVGTIKNNDLDDLISSDSERPLKILDCGIVFKLK